LSWRKILYSMGILEIVFIQMRFVGCACRLLKLSEDAISHFIFIYIVHLILRPTEAGFRSFISIYMYFKADFLISSHIFPLIYFNIYDLFCCIFNDVRLKKGREVQ